MMGVALYMYVIKADTIIVFQVLDFLFPSQGMNYLHYEAPIPVIHRDLKSRNG